MINSLKLALTIVLRHWTIYRKDLIANISPSVADPGLILLSLGVGLGSMVAQVEGKTYLQFLAPGLVASTALFTSFFESSYGFYIRMKMESVYKAMLTTPIGPKEIIMGEFIWNFFKGVIMASGVSLFLMCFGLVNDWFTVLGSAFVGGFMAIPCAAIGLLASSYVNNINQFQTVYSFGIAPMFYLSGIFFPLTSLPQYIQYALQLSPVFHGVRLMQILFWKDFDANIIVWHSGFLIAFSVLLSWWGTKRIHKMLVT